MVSARALSYESPTLPTDGTRLASARRWVKFVANCTRQIITVPPRHLKSVTAAVALPAFLLGRDPSVKIIIASCGSDLAARHARDFRLVTASPAYRKLFPRYQVNPMRDTAFEVEASLRDSFKAVSTGGAVTGFGADMIIIDDLMKAGDTRSDLLRERARAYYDETLYSRLNDKQRGAVVAIQQRLHVDDFVAHLLGKGDFHHLNLPAIAEEPQRIPSYFGGVFSRARGHVLTILPTCEVGAVRAISSAIAPFWPATPLAAAVVAVSDFWPHAASAPNVTSSVTVIIFMAVVLLGLQWWWRECHGRGATVAAADKRPG